jgi:hypothetical protein
MHWDFLNALEIMQTPRIQFLLITTGGQGRRGNERIQIENI